MTSLDDRLRDLYAQAGPDDDELHGDLAEVRRQVRHRQLRRRTAAVIVVAAAALTATGLMLRGAHDDDRVITTVPPATDDTAPTPTTTTPTTATSTATTTTTTAALAGAPDIHAVDFGTLRITRPCADDSRSVTLVNGRAFLPLGPGARYEVDLPAVDYTDADGDGDEDAVVVIRCTFAGADVDVSAEARAYEASEAGSASPLGSEVKLPHLGEVHVEGRSVTATVVKYAADDAHCCPSGAAREVWRFDTDHFTLVSSTALPPQGSG